MNCMFQLLQHKWTLIFFDLLLTPKEVKQLELGLQEYSFLSLLSFYIYYKQPFENWFTLIRFFFFSSEKGGENHQHYSCLAALGFITHSCLPVSITDWYRSCMFLNAADFTNSSLHNCLNHLLNGKHLYGNMRVWSMQSSCRRVTKHTDACVELFIEDRLLVKNSARPVGFNIWSVFILILWVMCSVFFMKQLYEHRM